MLEHAGLRTDPDFEAVYIDSLVQFVRTRAEPVTLPGQRAEPAAEPAQPAATPLALHPAYQDPTYRISKLAAANKPVVFIAPDATLCEAVTLMLANDFSQLPVMTTEREVKGVISWQSIGSRLALGRTDGFVREFMEQAQEIDSQASLFAAIPAIIAHQYVLVRGPDRRVVGIVTASDLSLQFQQLAEPFLLLAEIENHLRRMLAAHLSQEDLREASDPADQTRQVTSVSDLTFGEYVRLMENERVWTKVGLPVDRTTFVRLLARVRDVRNDVMHFDPDGIPPHDMDSLRDFARFLQRLQLIGVC